MSSPQPSSAMNARRISRPSAVRTGTFWRFGASLEMRPVVVASLLERRVDAAVGADERRQRVGVGAAQLLDLAVAQQRLDDRVLLGHLLQRVGVGRRPGLRLLHRREAELLEQDRAQLRRGVHVELLARVRVDLGLAAGGTASPSSLPSSSRKSTSMRMPACSIFASTADERPLEPLVEVGELARLQRLVERRRRAAARPRPGDRSRSTPASPSRSSVPSTRSGDAARARGTAARGPRARYFPSPGSSRYAITAVSWCERAAASTSSPCISSLARCATSGGLAVATSAPSAFAHRARRRAASASMYVTSSSVGDAERRRARLRPGAPSQRGSTANALAARRERAAALARPRRASRSDVDLDVERLGLGRLGDRRRPPRAAAAAACGTRAGRTAPAPARGRTRPGGGRRARRRRRRRARRMRHLAVQEHAVARTRRGSGVCFGGSSSRCSKIPSRSP